MKPASVFGIFAFLTLQSSTHLAAASSLKVTIPGGQALLSTSSPAVPEAKKIPPPQNEGEKEDDIFEPLKDLVSYVVSLTRKEREAISSLDTHVVQDFVLKHLGKYGNADSMFAALPQMVQKLVTPRQEL